MKSYASIDRIEGKFAVCEVELIPIEESNPEDFINKEATMIDVALQSFNNYEVDESDIFVVEHDGENVNRVYYKDDEEKQKRIEVIRGIIEDD